MKLIVNLEGYTRLPFQVYSDIAHQIDSAALFPAVNEHAIKGICELNSVNDWINLESYGNTAALKAYELFQLLKSHLTKLSPFPQIHIYCPDGILGSDNQYALLYLGKKICSLQIHIYTKAEKSEVLHLELKSLINSGIKITTRAYHEFAENIEHNQILNSLSEKRDETLKKMGFDLKPLIQNPNLAQYQIGIIIGYAWITLKAGAPYQGTQLLQKMMNNVSLSKNTEELLFMHLQLIRFLSHQYEIVANCVFPDHFNYLSADDKTSLFFIKAYAATISRNLVIAEIYFKKAKIDEHLSLDNENALYRLNLYALFLVLKGQENIALEAELRIQKEIEGNDIQITGLRYVNYINIARLYKKSREYEKSLKYYHLAYNEIQGGYTPSDRIYYHMNIGSVYESLDQLGDAFHHWFKAALFWLSYDNKYALSWRPRLILAQEKINDILQPLSIEKVHEFIYGKLYALANLNQIQIPEFSNEYFLTSESSTPKETCYSTQNLILYGCSISSNLPDAAREDSKLAKLVSALLPGILGTTPTEDVLVVDSTHEFNYPQSESQAWILSALTGCKQCYYQNKFIKFSNNQTEHLLNHTKITITQAINVINRVDGAMQLQYKRSFLNKTLSNPEEIEYLRAIEQPSFQLALNNHPTLIDLIQKKIISVVFPEI